MAGHDESCVIFNPMGGRGLTRRRIEAFRPAAPTSWTFRPTESPGHAEALAREAAREGFGTVIAAGGDGTVHEVANGIIDSGAEVTLAVLPCGSANDYAFALGWPAGRKALRQFHPAGNRSQIRVDVGRVAAPGRTRYFVNGLGLGFNGAVTVESRRIRWLRGLPLYGLAFIQALRRHFVCPPMTVTMDRKPRCTPTLALTVSLGRREGGFLLTPDAKLDDGMFDYLHAANMSRWELLKNLPRMVSGTLPTDHPRLALGRARAVSVESATPFRIHLDGEFFCHPEDGVCQVEVELLPGRLLVETFSAPPLS